MIELIVTGVLIPTVGALIWMLKRENEKSERHDKMMIAQCNKLMKHQEKLTGILNNHFKTDQKMNGRILRSLRVIAKELNCLNERIKP
jgi:hypothetical protein